MMTCRCFDYALDLIEGDLALLHYKALSHSKLTHVRQREGSSLACAICKLAFLSFQKRGTKAHFHITVRRPLESGIG